MRGICERGFFLDGLGIGLDCILGVVEIEGGVMVLFLFLDWLGVFLIDCFIGDVCVLCIDCSGLLFFFIFLFLFIVMFFVVCFLGFFGLNLLFFFEDILILLLFFGGFELFFWFVFFLLDRLWSLGVMLEYLSLDFFWWRDIMWMLFGIWKEVYNG